MNKEPETSETDRRGFTGILLRVAAVLGIGGLFSRFFISNAMGNVRHVWQLDPNVCVQCGRCADSCILAQSAVKCVHAYEMCGYCDLCGGYLEPKAKELNTAAENQLCPTAAIKRTYIEDPYFEYTIDEGKCIGCGKCVKGCGAFGNGSLFLQVRHDRCANCNECAIARVCPVDAFRRVPVDNPYLLKG